MPSDAIRRAVETAVREKGKPLADLTPEEVVALHERALFYFTLEALARLGRSRIGRAA